MCSAFNQGQPDTLNIALGIIITLISLGWTGWSYTAEETLAKENEGHSETTNAIPGNDSSTNESKKVRGIVTGADAEKASDSDYMAQSDSIDDNETSINNSKKLSSSWKLNVVLVVVTCFSAMILTGWGKISADGSLANPSVGDVAMWMIMASQWLALSLYIWTLVAPKLFPNREFG
jgi:hypothetical protein